MNTKADSASRDDVILKRARGTSKCGGMLGGFYWHIHYKNVKAGKVFINFNEIAGEATIQIFLNKKNQGMGVGHIALSLACDRSSYDRIIADIRKSNIASIKTATYSGFVPMYSNGTNPQLRMEWNRCQKTLT